MVSSCVNPDCNNEFLYLRDGELFVVRSSHSVEYFWLCPECAAEYRVVYEPEEGAKIVAKPLDSDQQATAPLKPMRPEFLPAVIVS